MFHPRAPKQKKSIKLAFTPTAEAKKEQEVKLVGERRKHSSNLWLPENCLQKLIIFHFSIC